MSAWTDARDNIRHGLTAMWVAFSPFARGLLIGFGLCLMLVSGVCLWFSV